MISLQDLQIGSQVAEDYRFIIKSRSVLNQVIDSLQLDLDYDKLNGMVTVTNPNNTHIIRTAVRSGDLALSRYNANELLSVSIERIYQVVGTNEPSVIDYSEANAVEDVSISFSKFVLIGALVGFLLVAVIVIIRMVMNSTIRTEDDVEKYLGMTVLAAIPYYDEKKK
jgi:capsular polysaccharide biosynthesis protein